MKIPFVEFLLVFLFNFFVCTFHAIPFTSDKFYDLTGALSFISVTIYSLIKNFNNLTKDAILMATMGIVWAFRIGYYLFFRTLSNGLDSRFEMFRNKPLLMYYPFFLQFLWTSSLLLPSLAVIYNDKNKVNKEMKSLKYLGYILWIIGFITEITADFQKKIFIDKGLKLTQGFISSGLWAYSRHPNYLGEITLWLGMALIAFAKLKNLLVFIAPVITFILLNFVSGINLIEKKTYDRLKNNKKYLKYLEEVPKLFPNFNEIISKLI